MSGFFYNLGRQFGHKALPALRKSKYIWEGVTGGEEEAFRAEVGLGSEMATELRASIAMVPEATTTRMLDETCARLASRLKDKRRTFRCEIFHDTFPNAIALPGGFLFLSDSLLDLCGRDLNELVFVLGHEIAHVDRGHAWDRLFNEAVLRMASAATARVGQLGVWLRQQGLTMLRSAHSNEQELQADELGLRLALAEGYPAGPMLHFLERLGQLDPSRAALGQYLASHPSPGERLAQARRVSQSVAARP